MIKKYIFVVVAVHLVFAITDFIIHFVIMTPYYEATAELWRPMDEIKKGLAQLVTLVIAMSFSAIYIFLVDNKSPKRGALYGFLYGLGSGTLLGIGTYTYTPIPLGIAVVWALAPLGQCALAGLVADYIIKVGGRD